MNEYSRSFIPLKQDSPGFSMNEKLPVGKCIIEITKNNRAKISIFVSNVKPETVYKVYLISGTNAGSVCAGTLPVDSWGKGEAKWEYNSQTLENGLAASQIDVVTVIVPAGDRFTAVLTGYKDFEIMWKNNFRPADTITKKLTTVTEVSAKVDEYIDANNKDSDSDVALPEDRPSETAASSTEINEKIPCAESELENSINSTTGGAYENIMNMYSPDEKTMESSRLDNGLHENDSMKNERRKTEGIENEGLNFNSGQDSSKPNIHEVFMEMAESFKAGLKSIEDHNLMSDEDLSSLMSGFENPNANMRGIESIFSKNLKILPFTGQSRQIEWVKIGIRELIYLPLNFMRIANDPIITCLYRRYRHLILGRPQNGNAGIYYLGIPSEYDEKNALMLAQLGFVRFEECEKDEKSKAGYYIMRL